MARTRKLRNILVEEVSLVDHPANQRSFMFVKAAGASDGPPASDHAPVEKAFKAIDMIVKSDGTREGTTIRLNGRELVDIRGLVLSLSPVGDDMSIYAEYSVMNRGKTADGFEGYATYRLTKAEDGSALVGDIAKVEQADIDNIEAYLEDLPTSVRQSVQNIIGAVRKKPEEPKTKEKAMPNEDGSNKTPEQSKMEAPVVDVNQIASQVVAQLTQQGLTADAITSAVLGRIETDRKARDAAAAAEAKAHADKVAAGEELEFASEEDMLAHLASEANKEALDEAEKSSAAA
jgi:hypothetical protein